MKDYDCYLFDADGTLIDTMELIHQCFCFTCGRFLDRSVSREEIRALVGLPLRASIQKLFGTLSDEHYEEIRSAHMGRQLSIYHSHLRAFPGVAETLQVLKQRGKRLGVVTSRMMESLGLYLDTVGIRSYFDLLVTPADTTRHKPEPEPVLKALELLDVKATDAVYVGDASFDIECGNRAGVDTVFVAWSHNDPGLFATKPVWYINSMSDLVTVS